jgi:hypothetical protein
MLIITFIFIASSLLVCFSFFLPDKFLLIYKKYREIVRKTTPINPGEPIFIIYENHPKYNIWTARIGGIILMIGSILLMYFFIKGRLVVVP